MFLQCLGSKVKQHLWQGALKIWGSSGCVDEAGFILSELYASVGLLVSFSGSYLKRVRYKALFRFCTNAL